MTAAGASLDVEVVGLRFRNPVILAAGTAAYGRELAGTVALERLGGLVTKAISALPRPGAPAPRVAEFPGGMINAVGLANPGVDAVVREHLPWLRAARDPLRVLANIVGFGPAEFAEVIERLEAGDREGGGPSIDAYELNVSCPNVKAGGMEFGADLAALREVVARSRAVTRRPLAVKLSPTLASIGDAARVAVDAGADAITTANTVPGLVVDVAQRRAALGFGTGGASGRAVLPMGVLATYRVRSAVTVPIIGVGGIATAEDALQYILAGASLVGMGTAMLRDPRAPGRLVAGLEAWCARHGVDRLADLTGTLRLT